MPAAIAFGASIPCLLARRRPAAILRRVRAVIVDAINRVARRWAWSHIGEEVLKAAEPSRADRDTSAAVAGVVTAPGIETAILDSTPRLEFARLGLPVCSTGDHEAFPVETPARQDLHAQVILSHGRLNTAVTSTAPYPVAGVWPGRLVKDDQPAESPPTEISIPLESPYRHGRMLPEEQCVVGPTP